MVILPNDFAKVANAITLCKWQPGVLYTAAGVYLYNTRIIAHLFARIAPK